MARSKYRELADQFRSAIDRGDYLVGTYLPHQKFIADERRVSIGTVRNAMDYLQSQGLVDIVRGHGAKVLGNDRVRLRMDRYIQTTEKAGPWEVACAARGLKGTTDVTGVSYCPANSQMAAELGITEGDEVVVRTNRMRIGDHVVRQLQTTWLPGWVAKNTPLSLPDKIAGGIYRGLEAAGYHPDRSEEMVLSRIAIPVEIQEFKIRAGSSVLDARRTTWDDKDRILVRTHVVVPADHVCFVYPQTLRAELLTASGS